MNLNFFNGQCLINNKKLGLNKKESSLCSLFEVEHFLCCIQDSFTFLNLCSFFKNFRY